LIRGFKVMRVEGVGFTPERFAGVKGLAVLPSLAPVSASDACVSVWGLGFGVWGVGFGVWGLGFGV